MVEPSWHGQVFARAGSKGDNMSWQEQHVLTWSLRGKKEKQLEKHVMLLVVTCFFCAELLRVEGGCHVQVSCMGMEKRAIGHVHGRRKIMQRNDDGSCKWVEKKIK